MKTFYILCIFLLFGCANVSQDEADPITNLESKTLGYLMKTEDQLHSFVFNGERKINELALQKALFQHYESVKTVVFQDKASKRKIKLYLLNVFVIVSRNNAMLTQEATVDLNQLFTMHTESMLTAVKEVPFLSAQFCEVLENQKRGESSEDYNKRLKVYSEVFVNFDKQRQVTSCHETFM